MVGKHNKHIQRCFWVWLCATDLCLRETAHAEAASLGFLESVLRNLGKAEVME